MKNMFIVKREWSLLFFLPLVFVIAQAWSIPNKSNAPTKTKSISTSAAVVSLIKICGGASTFEDSAASCYPENLQVRFEEECSGDVPMNVFLTNLHPDPAEDVLYDLPANVPDIYVQHEVSPGEFQINGPFNQAMVKGKVLTISGEHVPVFGIDIGLYTTATNEVGCTPGQQSTEHFPIAIRLMRQVGADNYELYPLAEHSNVGSGIFSCDVFLETHCICYGGTCLNDGYPNYEPDVCMVCECKEGEKPEDRLTAPNDITAKGVSDVSLSPNPFKEYFTLSFNLKKAETTQISILDFQGKEMTVTSLDLAEGQQNHRIETNGYPAGIYYLQLIASNQRITKKLIVLK